MPVYLLTAHAYRSWQEDHRKGYVQRAQGLKDPSERLARWRANHAKHEPARFSRDIQEIILNVASEIARERNVRLHASAATLTHVHILISFRSPACTCGAAKYCRGGCPGRAFAEKVIVRMKQKMGQAVARSQQTVGRQWFSRGWDMTPVRERAHFDRFVSSYLPKHASEEDGLVRICE
ncbi:MAG: hypothetical protein ABSB33_10510 [Tepidisphaeraceae bacterium]|jgi:hypothetical protein